MGSTAIRTLAVWRSMNSFWRPGVNIINTVSIWCSTKVSFSTFKNSSNTYFLNYLCQTWLHGRHLVDSSIAFLLKSLTLPNVCAFILSKLLIALMGFPWLGAAFYAETAHEGTSRMLNNVRHTWYVVSQCRPFDSGGLKRWLPLVGHRVIGWSIISRNSK